MRRRLLVAALLTAVALPPAAQAKFFIRMNLHPAAAQAGEQMELALRAYGNQAKR